MNFEEQIKKDRFRNFNILLYKDTTSYKFDDIIFKLNEFKYYAYIEHKPETDEKKSHIHLFLHLDNATTIDAISNKLGIPLQFIQSTKSVRSSIRYLTHIDYPNKIQYSLDNVTVSNAFKRQFLKNFEDLQDETSIISTLFDFISSLGTDYDYYNALIQLIIFVNSNCYDTIYRRYKSEFVDYLKSLYL